MGVWVRVNGTRGPVACTGVCLPPESDCLVRKVEIPVLWRGGGGVDPSIHQFGEMTLACAHRCY